MKVKNHISNTASLLVALWYVAAIVGLDIHTNHHDGEVFVVSLLGHTDCESLHPTDKCHCMEHHHGLCHEHDEDCENETVFVSLTGDGFDSTFDFTPIPVSIATFDTPAVEKAGFCVSYFYIDCEDPPRERLRSLNVLRV